MIFRETLEIYKDKAPKLLKEDFQNQVPQDVVQVTNTNETSHKRQKPILSRAELLALPLGPSTAEHLKKMVPKDL